MAGAADADALGPGDVLGSGDALAAGDGVAIGPVEAGPVAAGAEASAPDAEAAATDELDGSPDGDALPAGDPGDPAPADGAGPFVGVAGVRAVEPRSSDGSAMTMARAAKTATRAATIPWSRRFTIRDTPRVART